MSDLRDAPSQLFLTCYPTKADLSWFAAELERDPVARAKTPDTRKAAARVVALLKKDCNAHTIDDLAQGETVRAFYAAVESQPWTRSYKDMISRTFNSMVRVAYRWKWIPALPNLRNGSESA